LIVRCVVVVLFGFVEEKRREEKRREEKRREKREMS